MVRALTSHHCVPGLIPGPGVICGLSLLLVLFLALRGFAAGTPVFPSPQKPTFPNSNLIWNCQALYHEPLAQVIVQALPVFDIKFEFTIKFLIARILLYTCIHVYEFYVGIKIITYYDLFTDVFQTPLPLSCLMTKFILMKRFENFM